MLAPIGGVGSILIFSARRERALFALERENADSRIRMRCRPPHFRIQAASGLDAKVGGAARGGTAPPGTRDRGIGPLRLSNVD